jgi:hypothetical protein
MPHNRRASYPAALEENMTKEELVQPMAEF